MEVNINDYAADFVRKVTSDASNHTSEFISRVMELDKEVNAALLLTAGLGMATEAGEFGEIIKKAFFQGKPLGHKEKEHLRKELGDVLWYWANACRALGIAPTKVMEENILKLEARYPGGEFDAFYSENREEGDV